MIQSLSISLLPALMIVAAMTDVASLRIPNWLTGLIAVLFFPMALLTGMPLAEFGWHMLAGFILFFAGYALFAAGLFGGGDAKLMAAAGLWFGTQHTLPFLVLTAVAGGALAVGMGIWAMAMMEFEIHEEKPAVKFLDRFRKLTPKLPYGFAFAIGAIMAFPQTWWMNVS